MEMFQINFVEGIPIYRQVVDHIRFAIKSGVMEDGMQLPTMRELTKQLNVAQGTVKRAYDELSKEGLLKQVQGRGTFVEYKKADPNSRKERAMAAIDAMLDELEGMNFSMAETRIYLDLKLRAREMKQENLKVAVIECNPEGLSQIAAQLRLISDIDVFPHLLEEVRGYPYHLSEEVDLVITTASHDEEISRLIPSGQNLARISLRLRPRCVRQLVRLPEDSTIRILSKSAGYGEHLRRACEGYAEQVHVRKPGLLGDPAGCADLLASADAVLVPEEFERYCSAQELLDLSAFEKEKPLIRGSYRIDEGSYMYVEEKIQRMRARQKI